MSPSPGADGDEACGPAPVSVARLTLSAFRCYAYRRFEVAPASVVLTGPNGAGKTTVLEALSLLAPGRGLRRARLDELMRVDPAGDGTGGGAWAVAAKVRTPSGDTDIGTGLEPGLAGARRERRHVRIDAQPARAHASLASILTVSWLTPEMDRLFTEGASARRRFLDRLVFALDPDHARRVSAYESAMQERSRLLRSGAPDAGWLAALEETMAAGAVAVAAARLDLAERLNAHAAAGGFFAGATLAAAGTVEDWLAADRTALAVECRLREALEQARTVDAEAGGASIGPHRSDLVVRHSGSGRPARACSTGEQKMLLIAIVLAGARLQRSERGVAPLLLLDEVAAHLDARHRDALFAEVAALGTQAWYAGTDRTVFAPLAGRAQFISLGQESPAGGIAAG
ncbi:MAG: DNA replication/repair protein RecF [Rhodospirillales bacterium]|nr:DNA replication/repair protein RecF [Rhodospirillales bacterium]